MADVVVGPLVQNLVSLLQTEFTLIGGVKKDVEKLTGTLSTIQAVLEDAEAKQFKEKSIADWLNKLKDAAYGAEDALDLWLTTTRQRELELTDASSSKQVSCSIPTCLNFKEIIFRHKIAKRLKEIISKIDDIAEQKNKFHLNYGTVPQTEYSGLDQYRETSSKLIEPKIYGRDNDQKNIIDELLSNESREDLSVFPLLGFGGVGKTTLAQLVYNDERVCRSFPDRIWVCVSEPFDVKRILKEIIESFQQESCRLQSLQSIQTKVEELLKDKKYLLVLDDVWNENENEWNKLRSFIKSGAKGSSVMITTRSQRVASITATITPYRVGVLSDDDCWSLLKHRALGDKDEEQYPQNLVSIGKDIMKRCKGVPLAAKSLGSLLCSKTEENHWINVRDSEIWNLESGEDDILPALRLSYNHLPPNLKQCFSYCSIFPKDHQINKTELIYFWIANGFIQPKGKMELEEIGDGIFNELLQWSFFQDTTEDRYGNIETCKLHDLMHDLASSIAKNDCQIVKVDERTNVSERIRHLTVDLVSEQSSTAFNPPFLRSVPSLRTLLFLGSPNVDGFVFQRTLRVLDIRRTRMKALPPSVLHLKQLRYLNLSYNHLKSLPESICRLVNLQVLNLNSNKGFESLPSSIGKLEHLRYLSLSHTNISSLPDSICRLVNLQVLNLNSNEGFESLPSSIGKLEHLRYLSLSHTNISSLPDSICRLRNLWWLDLSSNKKITILPQSIGKLTNLRHLNLSSGFLESLPETVCDLMNLQSLLLYWCEKLKELPKNMKNMRSLIHLDNFACFELRKLPSGLGELTSLRTLGYFPVGDDDSDSDRRDGCGSGAAGINELHGLNQLREKLWIDGLENVRNAEEARMANLRSKQYLTELFLEWSYYYDEDGSLQAISNNKKSQEVLQGLLPLPPNLQELNIYGYGAEEFPPQIFQGEGRGGGGVLNTTTLQSLEISKCPKLKSLPAEIGDLKALKSLKIWQCEELVSFPKELQKLTSLTELSIRECNRIKYLPTIGGGGVGSENNNSFLDSLEISKCRNLTSVSEGLRYLTSLKQLKLRDCGELELELGTPGFEHLVSLETLRLKKLPKLIALPQGIRHLRELEIKRCPELAIEEEKDLWNLVSLETLRLNNLPKLTALPQGIRHLPMLQYLEIWECENLRTLPDWLKHLTTLQFMNIFHCHPDLTERCKRDEGEDWHKISHIPDIWIDQDLMLHLK